MALSLRQPIPGVAAALLLLGFGFTVDNVPRVLVLALVFLVLAACVLALSRSLERRTWRLRDAIPGVLVGGAGAALAVLLLGAAPSAVATPWRDWRAWNPFDQGSSVYSFNWLQNYPQLLDPQNNAVIMRVESSSPAYWRANALDQFTGDAWISSQSFTRERRATSRCRPAIVYTIPAADPAPSGTTVTEKFRIRSVYTNYFFTGGDPSSLSIGQDVTIRMNDMRSLHVVNALGPSLDYTLEAVIPKVTPDSLVGLGRDYPEGMENYLSLPFPAPSQHDRGGHRRRLARDHERGVARAASSGLDLYDLNQTHRRRCHRPLRDRAAAGALPPHPLPVRPAAAGQRHLLPLRRLPFRHRDRLLPALRRSDGPAAPVQRASRRGWPWASPPGTACPPASTR